MHKKRNFIWKIFALITVIMIASLAVIILKPWECGSEGTENIETLHCLVLFSATTSGNVPFENFSLKWPKIAPCVIETFEWRLDLVDENLHVIAIEAINNEVETLAGERSTIPEAGFVDSENFFIFTVDKLYSSELMRFRLEVSVQRGENFYPTGNIAYLEFCPEIQMTLKGLECDIFYKENLDTIYFMCPRVGVDRTYYSPVSFELRIDIDPN